MRYTPRDETSFSNRADFAGGASEWARVRAVVVDRYQEPSELRVLETEEPACGEGEVMIEVGAAGCNFFDTLIVRGKYQVKPPFPFVPGGEVSGTIVCVGRGVLGKRVGDRVMSRLGYGGFAERCIAPAKSVYPMDPEMPFEEAAALPIVYGTAYAALVVRGACRAGDHVLVTAAAGGVGLATVQIAKALGARVIAAASRDKLEVATRAGADVAIDYREDGWEAQVNDATAGRGVDVVVENVGGDVFDACTRCVGWGGRLVVSGFASGRIPEIRVNRVLLKHIAIVGVHWGPMAEHEPELVAQIYAELLKLYRDGKVRPYVHRAYPLDSVAEALAALAGRETVGKIVLVP